jgi:hypothetical protein
MILGRVFFRDVQFLNNDKRQFLLVGKIWLPANTEIRGERVYTVAGEETAREGQSVILLQTLLNGAENISEQSKNKSPNKLFPLIKLP